MRRDLAGAIAAYPDARVRFAPPVAWLVTPIRPIQGLPDVAHLVTCYSLEAGAPIPGRSAPVVSWAWWDMGIWIGPRHTNFPDGSICAFESTHGTWAPKKGLLLWLDLHAVWIVRQLYLRYFGRWPGDQVLHTALERLHEHRPDELCGCGSFQRYKDCHRTADLAMGGYLRHREFHARYRNAVRHPDPEARSMLESMLWSRQ